MHGPIGRLDVIGRTAPISQAKKMQPKTPLIRTPRKLDQ
jgi:hypothetical protein